ncbi:hypothetical protein ACJMK2_022476 [Sinanodonta woodiana]|uniref:C-type lectin domain-containing protein n=1 Tax=Sinanodonta woodiana TaxID=1069815 RepID=A0ABD3TJD1_SINWO
MRSGWTEPCITDDTSIHCYEIVDTLITWKNASDLCKYDGGNLVTIESAEEQKYITDVIKRMFLKARSLWIGSDMLHPEEERAWSNGEKLSYENWAKGEPNNVDMENCVILRTNNSMWNDVKCTEKNGYICENSCT